MKSRETMAELNALIREAVEPGKLEDLLTVIEYDLGYELYRAVSAAKVALSGKEETTLSFSQMGVIIEKPVSYTHLDVYKRQAWHRAEKWMPLFGRIRCLDNDPDRHFASDRTRDDLEGLTNSCRKMVNSR